MDTVSNISSSRYGSGVRCWSDRGRRKNDLIIHRSISGQDSCGVNKTNSMLSFIHKMGKLLAEPPNSEHFGARHFEGGCPSSAVKNGSVHMFLMVSFVLYGCIMQFTITPK